MITEQTVRLFDDAGAKLQEVTVVGGEELKVELQGVARVELVDPASGLGPQRVTFRRDGQDLIIEPSREPSEAATEDATISSAKPRVRLLNYYDQDPPVGLVGQVSDGTLVEYLPQDQELSHYAANLSDSTSAVQTLGGGETAAAVGVLAFQPLLAAVGGLAVLGGGGGGGASPNTALPSTPTNTHVHDTDGDGQPNVTGSADPGTTIKVTTPDGQTFTGVVDASGHYDVDTSGVNPVTGTYSVTSTHDFVL